MQSDDLTNDIFARVPNPSDTKKVCHGRDIEMNQSK